MTLQTELVNQILEAERKERGGITWTEFARQLGVHHVTLWKWRHGYDLGPAANALLPLVVKHHICASADHHSAAESVAA